MTGFLLYEGKAAIVLLVFYLFYRFLLRKETFHRFNRVVLVGTAVLSSLLPLCIITIHKPAEFQVQVMEPDAGAADSRVLPAVQDYSQESALDSVHATGNLSGRGEQWWHVALFVLFCSGAVAVLVRMAVSILSIIRIIKESKLVGEDGGCRILVAGRDIEPFSWMKYIVLSQQDFESGSTSIIAHEKAHAGNGHSIELLLVDVMSALQWFNPAIWMLRGDLQELHEYEADDYVLRTGADIKEYQYLLIRKAVGKSGYSVANSFNHSILKKRITMMSKPKSPLARGLRVLYVLPLVCLCLGLQAQTVYQTTDKSNEKTGNSTKVLPQNGSPLYILFNGWGEEKEITKGEFDKIAKNRIRSLDVLTDAQAKEMYGNRGLNGVIMVTLKRPQELDELVVVSYAEEEQRLPFYVINPDTMPLFQGEDMQAFHKWLLSRITRPEGCRHTGTMTVRFEVTKEGSVKDVKVLESVCEELDAMVVSLIEQSPKWEPATLKGKPIPQGLKLPIVFEMR